MTGLIVAHEDSVGLQDSAVDRVEQLRPSSAKRESRLPKPTVDIIKRSLVVVEAVERDLRNHNMRFSENSSGPLKHPILESLNVQLHQNIRSQLHSGEDIVQAMDLDLFVSSTACLREGLLVQVRHGEQRRGWGRRAPVKQPLAVLGIKRALVSTPKRVGTKRTLHFAEAVHQRFKRVDPACRKQSSGAVGKLAGVCSDVEHGPDRYLAQPAIRRNPVDVDAEASDGGMNREAEVLGEADTAIVSAMV
jgi:hypothetical protein